jgi:methylated-DNA-[protein]-cysteine S-methyltransferase
MNRKIFKTKWGWVGVAATASGVAAVVLPRQTRREVERELASDGLMAIVGARRAVPLSAEAKIAARHIRAARAAVEAYLNGEVRYVHLPLDLEGQPRFRRKVWEVLQTIPYGRVRSYGWVARKIGKPQAARAVGGACGANPVPLLVPCHRVIAGDGSLGGFSGGLDVKKRLLRLEGAL